MGCFFQTNCIIEPINPQNNSPSIVPPQNDHKLKTHLKNMIWDTGLSCIFSTNRRRTSGGRESSEHNKAWLLAESGGSDPQSVHSSFRFTICSQVELETLKSSSCNAGATVLMVNLDNGSTDLRSKELKFSKIESLERSISTVANTLIRFGYDELVSCTRNFSKGRVLGRGALSCVFRGRVGFLRNAVAIKRLAKEDKESANAFYRELMIASSLQNPNVVPLVGFCIHPEEGLFLVYKYVSGGSLEHHLHEKKSLSWSVRYKVAVAIAEAVSYLHVGTERCVVHRDIKPSNILLTAKKTPKLCDFGLATWTTAPSVPFLCKTVKGTFGYLAPEYFQHGKVSDKTDVYAYGVVLLELITGRKPIEAKRPPGEENLVLWAKPFLQSGKGSIEELIDIRPKLTPKKLPLIARMVQAAAACVNSDESKRLSIDKIISILKDEEQFIYPDRKKLSSSGKRCIIDSHPNLRQTENDMTSHLALAMLGVSEFGDEDQSYYR